MFLDLRVSLRRHGFPVFVFPITALVKMNAFCQFVFVKLGNVMIPP